MSEKVYQDAGWLDKKYNEEGLTQSEMAEIADTTQKTISTWLIKTGVKEKADRASGSERKNGACKNPATFGTYHDSTGGAYERWQDSENKAVKVHRLLAVAEYGFDAVKDLDVHHKREIPWLNYHDNIELVSRKEHQRLHNRKD